MDLRKTTVPKSDQLNADDLIAGPVTVTIERVEEGSAEQPVNVYLAEYPGRPYRPSKSMQRVLMQVWGWDTDVFHGRRMTLFRNEKITFGRDEVGGIQISHLSHIDKPMYPAITPKRGSKKPFPVKPLVEVPTTPALAPDVLATMSVDELRTHYTARQNAGATPDELAQIAALATENKED